MSNLSDIIYNGPKPQTFLSKVVVSKRPTGQASLADFIGLIVFTSETGKSGVSLSWGELVLRVGQAIQANPEFKQDILKLCNVEEK